MHHKLCLSLLFTLYFWENRALAQNDSTVNRTHYYYEAGTFLSTSDKIPFWLRTNQYGIVPNKAPIITFRGGIYRDYKKLITEKYDWGYGVDAAINVGVENKIYLPEAYLKVKLNKFEFYAGRRREIIGLVDSSLTSGSYSWSGNALPMPKIQLSIPNYLPILGNGLLSIKGSYTHGWFDNQGIVKDFYLHQKTFYARLGKPNWKIKMYAGFNHEVQWGGVPSIKLDSTLVGKDGKYPSSLKDYWYVVTGKSLNSVLTSEQSQYAFNDAVNRVGNHLGSVDLAIEIDFAKASLFIYRQNLFETGTLFHLTSIQDGLHGFSFRNKLPQRRNLFLKEILLEYLYTVNQGGTTPPGINYAYIPTNLQGEVNYFNQAQYLNGWTYLSKTIGTPFLTPNPNLIPLANQAIYNNRVSAIYLAFKGNIKQIPFEARFSYSQNYGTYIFSMDKPQFSSSIKTHWILPKFKDSLLITQLSIDLGSLYNNNLSIYVGIKKKGII